VLNLCANNYLGLAGHPAIVGRRPRGAGSLGFTGLSSVRFICGTQELHKQLESKLSTFLGTDDTILYSSCFDANGGLFETLLGPEDAIISDELNHASIIDGVRLCKSPALSLPEITTSPIWRRSSADRPTPVSHDRDRRRFFRWMASSPTLRGICDLAEKYDALVMVDDSHAVGFMGAHRPRHARAIAACSAAWISLPARSARALGGASGG